MSQSLLDLIDPDLLKPEPEDSRYANSPFRHIKLMLPKQKGSRYEKIVSNVCKKLGHNVKPPVSTDHDRIINDVKCEIKGSCLSKSTKEDVFSFLQIRADQDYDKILFAMFYPHELVVMEMDKAQLQACMENGSFTKQHGGQKANSGTYMYYGNKETLRTLGAREYIRV
jgi:hypothetical protein